MPHGLYNTFQNIGSPCHMGCTTLLKILVPHATWVVQCFSKYWIPMPHGLYNAFQNIDSPCHMDCATYFLPMWHGLYNTLENIGSPCHMGCTTLFKILDPHATWIVQHSSHPLSVGHTSLLFRGGRITHAISSSSSHFHIMIAD